MAKLEICSLHASSQKMEGKCKQVDEKMEPQDEPMKHQRLFQLSGFMIEVLERDEELDVSSFPYSFQVNTYKMHLQPDGRSSSLFHDSIILSATDEDTKKIWVKSIKFWNRYGWRDTVQVAATRRDLEKLQEQLQTYSNPTFMGVYPRYSSDEALCCDRNSAMAMYGGRSSYSVQTSCATRRQTKRRFYRTTVPSVFVPPSETLLGQN
ncbi:unnamed protein product [Peronospora belbahrii]|nr:unnamed protein product [Peronospora belbahrii]